MQSLISQVIEETLEEAFGHDMCVDRVAIQYRLEEALQHPTVTKHSRHDRHVAV